MGVTVMDRSIELDMAEKARVFNEITDQLLTVLRIESHLSWWETLIPVVGRTPCEMWLAGDYAALRGLVTSYRDWSFS